jgi:MoaA/NifB/PqqE/SkfB family radical SAM enzyme
MSGRRSPGRRLATLRAGVGLARARWTGRRRPVVVSWAVTHRCNLRCAYCDVPDRPLADLPTPRALDLIDQMAVAGTRAVSFNGGEPLMREDIGALVDRCGRRGMAVSLSTNGVLLDRHLPLLDRLSSLQLSVDGPREVHEALRGPGSWQPLPRAAAAARERGVPLVLSAVLARHNVDAVDDLVDLASAWGARLSVLPVGPVHAHSVDLEELYPPVDRMRAALARLADRAREGAPVLGSPSSFAYLAAWPDAPPIPCLAGRGLAKLSADGRLFPCAILEHRTAGSNALDRGFAAAFDALAGDPLRCGGCHCTKTLQLNRLLFDPVAALPYRVRARIPGGRAR